jgi:cellobiose phosphorylase
MGRKRFYIENIPISAIILNRKHQISIYFLEELMRYGCFSNDGREYIITRPDTPTPWINYISNLRGYCGIISQTAGGFSFHKDPRDRRLTKYRYNNVPVDRPGRYFYIKDEATSEYFSPTWQPVMKKPDSYECRHGQGYTVISQAMKDISTEVLYFVPADHDCEVWRLKISNRSNSVKKLSVYSYSEFTMWCEPESRNIQWSLHLTKGSFDREMVMYNFIEPHPAFDMNANKNYVGDRPGYAFMGMSEKVADFECVRDKFIGIYRSESNPEGVETDALSNSILRGGNGCAALRSSISIDPGEEREIIVTLGFAEKADDAVFIRDFYSRDGNVDSALAKVKASWTSYMDKFTLDSQDKDLNLVVNIWNQYQCKTTFDWSRYISFYENGEGRGMGTRDSCQDTLAISAQMPERARKRIFEILSTTQFETGDCYHQFFPNGGKGDLKGFSDDHLWLIQMVYHYICETGDFDILKEECLYADSKKKGSVYQHLVDAVNYTERMKGPHGLPLILTADWNDTLHLWMESDKPESVLTAGLYVHALRLLGKLSEQLGKKSDIKVFEQRADDMSELVNEKCWDGEWYIRGFGSETIGTKSGEKAKIFLNAQVWSVISGIATYERAAICMDSVKKMLSTEDGIKLLWPSFDAYDQTYGLISRYNTGRKENGIFAHANAWAICAECVINRPENAYEYYRNILPLKRNDTAEIFKTEPYVFCQAICSNDALNKGEGANSWLTGTASWMYVAATQYILGIKPTLNGLSVIPRVPASWTGFKVKRMYRGCEYEITIKRGIKAIEADGKPVTGTVIPVSNKKTCRVDVTI